MGRIGGQYQDRIDAGLGRIDPMHHAIHEGVAYHLSHWKASVPAGNVLLVRIVVAAKPVHLRVSAGSGQLVHGQLQIQEAPTFSNPGLIIRTGGNLNRNKPDTDITAVAYSDPVIGTPGTSIADAVGGSVHEQVGVISPSPEYVLKANTEYAIGLVNGTGSIQTMSIGMSFYERSET